MRLDPHYLTIWLHFLAHAHALKGEYEAAVPLLQQRIRGDPRVLLASCYGHLGRIDDAREIWHQVAEVNPEYSLEQKANVLPYKDPADWQRIVARLAKAGLVDKDGQGPADNTASRPSIAVLPFDNLSGDAEQEYFPAAYPKISSPPWRASRRCASPPAIRPFPTRANRPMFARSQQTWTSVMYSRAACARPAGGCVLPPS